MIIKRRVTRQFVQLENALVRDRKLTLDEHGMLHYLLSLPDDWEVTQTKCARFWNIGRDKCRRIFRSLRRTGWAQLEPLYTDDGSLIGTRWIIGDEPGPEPTAEALAKEEETDDESTAQEPTAAPESQNPDVLASSGRTSPCPTVGPPDKSDFPTVGKQGTSKKKESSYEETDSTNTVADASRENSDDDDDGEPPPRFGELLKMWPSDNVASPFACERIFAKFSDKQKREARDGIKPYLQDCRERGHNRLCDLKTFLDERRHEKFIGKTAIAAKLWTIRRGTPEAERWRKHYREHEPNKLSIFEMALLNQGWTTTSQWPPAMPPRSGPPTQPGMTEEVTIPEGFK